MKQQDRLLKYLESHIGIDPLTSWEQLGIYRLSSVIFDLRKQGHSIQTRTKSVLNKFNEECHVAYYVLEPKTVFEWYLTVEDNYIQSQLLANCRYSHTPARSLESAIGLGFSWIESPEGLTYWEHVNQLIKNNRIKKQK